MRMHNPPHPGPILEACFDEDRTIEATACKMGVPVQTLEDIINEKAPITPEVAVLLSTVITSIPPRTWLRLQERYDSWNAEHNATFRQEIFSLHKVSVKQDADNGLINSNLAFA